MRHPTILIALILFRGATNSSAGDRWPEWRGPTGQGIATVSNLPTEWGETNNVAWKKTVPGRGWSTPVIENGRVWVTTAIDRAASKEEAARRRKTSTNSQPLTISEFVSLRAIGVDILSGTIGRDIEVLSEKDPQMIHIENSYATPTPILVDGKLYCHFGPSGIGCVDTTSGAVLWTNRSLRVKHENGPGSSPILWNDLLIVHCDGIDQQYIVALDAATGKQRWKTARSGVLHRDEQMRKSYATPLVVEINGAAQIVSPAADWVYGYEPASGRELWKLSYGQLGFSNAARPIAGHGMVFVCTGYMKAQMLAIGLDSTKGALQPTVKWRYNKQVPNVACPILVGNEIYFASDNGVASCLDARSGRLHWSKRIGKRFWAAPIYGDGKLYFFDHDATATVLVAGKSFKRIAVNKLEGTQLAAAAAIDGTLVIRTDRALYCIR